MPQPISRMRKIKNLDFLTDPFIARPEHMECAYRIIVSASTADAWAGRILVGLSPEKGVSIAKHYVAQEDDAKKRASVETGAISFLSPEMHDLLKKVLTHHGKAMRRRHPFAHHHIGYTTDDKDLLLLRDPNDILLETARRAEVMSGLPPITMEIQHIPKDVHDQLVKIERTAIMSYRLNELLDIVRNINNATTNLRQFWLVTSQKLSPEITSQILNQLMIDLES